MVSPLSTDPPAAIKPFELVTNEDTLRIDDCIQDAYPLTSLQWGMLFHSAMSDRNIYEDCSTIRCHGPSNPSALYEALAETIARHDVLRTSFNLTDFSEPIQLVHRSIAPPLEVFDVSGVSDVVQRQVLDECFATVRSQAIDWRKVPLFRVLFHQLSTHAFQLTLKIHHAMRDGWSNGLLLEELLVRYLKHCGSHVSSDDSPLQSTFRDFVALEKQILGSVEARQFWADVLKDVECVRMASYDPDGAATSGHQGEGMCEVPLPSAVAEGLRVISRNLGISMRSILLTAHLNVLKVWTGRSDVLSGVVVNGRPESVDGERALGLFLNTVPFRQRLRAEMTWAEAIRETVRLELELMPFRRFPLAEIQRRVGLGDLFDCVFNFTDFSSIIGRIRSFADLRVVGSKFAEETNYCLCAQFTVGASEGERVRLALDYRTDCLSAEAASRIGHIYVSTLRAIAEDAGKRIWELELIGEEEREKLLVEWNQTEREYREEATLGELFEEQVKRSPGAVAVSCEGEQLSYEELNCRANRIAHYLRGIGVGPEVRVGLCLERSVEMVVSI